MAGFPQGPRVPFYRLVSSGVDLASVFKSAVDAFNSRDLVTLLKLCDENVVMMAIKRQQPYCGKQAISDYLTQQFRTRRSSFIPITTDTTINRTATIGHIIGAADWTDYALEDPIRARIEGSIRYAINFVSRGNGWLISTMWGSIDHLNRPADQQTPEKTD